MSDLECNVNVFIMGITYPKIMCPNCVHTKLSCSGGDVVKHEDGEDEYKVKDEEEGEDQDGVEVDVEEHLKEVGGSHELEDVPGLDRQLLRRAVVQVLHHLQGQGLSED